MQALKSAFPPVHCASRRPFELLAEYCRRQNIALCDASPAFQVAESPSLLFQEQTLGYSSEGHRIYARELAKRILRNSAGIWERPPSAGDRAQPWDQRQISIPPRRRNNTAPSNISAPGSAGGPVSLW